MRTIGFVIDAGGIRFKQVRGASEAGQTQLEDFSGGRGIGVGSLPTAER